MAILSGLGFVLTSRYMLTCLSSLPKSDSLTDFNQSNQRNHQDQEFSSLLRKSNTKCAYETSQTEPRSSMPKALKYLIQLCKGKNFAIFIAVSLLQGIGCFSAIWGYHKKIHFPRERDYHVHRNQMFSTHFEPFNLSKFTKSLV